MANEKWSGDFRQREDPRIIAGCGPCATLRLSARPFRCRLPSRHVLVFPVVAGDRPIRSPPGVGAKQSSADEQPSAWPLPAGEHRRPSPPISAASGSSRLPMVSIRRRRDSFRPQVTAPWLASSRNRSAHKRLPMASLQLRWFPRGNMHQVIWPSPTTTSVVSVFIRAPGDGNSGGRGRCPGQMAITSGACVEQQIHTIASFGIENLRSPAICRAVQAVITRARERASLCFRSGRVRENAASSPAPHGNVSFSGDICPRSSIPSSRNTDSRDGAAPSLCRVA